MSVTYGLTNHQIRLSLLNPQADMFQPFSEFYNPEFVSEPLYPEINVTNSNAHLICKLLNLGSPIGGGIPASGVDNVLQKVLSYSRMIMKDEFDITAHGFQHRDQVLSYMRRFEFMLKAAYQLHDGISWG